MSGSQDDDGPGHPIGGQAFMLAAAKASVPPTRLSTLLGRVQADLAGRRGAYRRAYERVHVDGDVELFLVEHDHWADVGDRLGLDRREVEAVARAHREQLLQVGGRLDRREEFETALDIREAVVVGP